MVTGSGLERAGIGGLRFAWMRRGFFVYCRRTQKRRQQDDDRATVGSAVGAQQALYGGFGDDRGGDVRGGDDGGDRLEKTATLTW